MQRKQIKMTTPMAKSFYLVTSNTLRRWHKEGKIEVQRNPSGHRIYIRYEEIPDEDEAVIEADKAAEQENLHEERRRLQKQVADFDSLPEEERSDLETGFIKFAIRPKLEKLEKLCNQN